MYRGVHKEYTKIHRDLCVTLRWLCVSLRNKKLNENGRRPEGKEASGKGGAAFYAAEAVRDLFEWKVKPQAEFLRGYVIVKMKVADGTVFVTMLMISVAKLFCLFFQRVVGRMLMAEGMKRLVSDSELH